MPSSPTACSREPAGADSSASRYRCALLAGDADQNRDEPVVVKRTVHCRRQPDHRRPYAAVSQRDDGVLRVDPRAGLARVVLGRGPAQPGDHQRSRRRDQRLPAAGQRVAHCREGAQVGLDGAAIVAGQHGLVLERQVDDSVGVGRGLHQAIGVVEISAQHFCASGGQLGGRLVRAGQADDGVSGFEKLGDDGGPDMAGRSGDEYAHEHHLHEDDRLSRSRSCRGAVMSVTVITLTHDDSGCHHRVRSSHGPMAAGRARPPGEGGDGALQ
jgi:hypothetical protein